MSTAIFSKVQSVEVPFEVLLNPPKQLPGPSVSESDLPDEIIQKIFKYIRVEDYANAALVCRRWRNISEADIYKLPLHRYIHHLVQVTAHMRSKIESYQLLGNKARGQEIRNFFDNPRQAFHEIDQEEKINGKVIKENYLRVFCYYLSGCSYKQLEEIFSLSDTYLNPIFVKYLYFNVEIYKMMSSFQDCISVRWFNNELILKIIQLCLSYKKINSLYFVFLWIKDICALKDDFYKREYNEAIHVVVDNLMENKSYKDAFNFLSISYKDNVYLENKFNELISCFLTNNKDLLRESDVFILDIFVNVQDLFGDFCDIFYLNKSIIHYLLKNDVDFNLLIKLLKIMQLKNGFYEYLKFISFECIDLNKQNNCLYIVENYFKEKKFFLFRECVFFKIIEIKNYDFLEIYCSHLEVKDVYKFFRAMRREHWQALPMGNFIEIIDGIDKNSKKDSLINKYLRLNHRNLSREDRSFLKKMKDPGAISTLIKKIF